MTNNNFNWYSEEDQGWPTEDQKPKSYKRRKRLWRPLILLLIMAIGAGSWAVSRQVSKRVEATTAAIEADVLASHNLVLDAGAEQDVELLRTVLSGRDPAWVEMLETLTAADSLVDRPAYEMVRVAGEGSGMPTITLDPELSSAELVYDQRYEVQTGEGVTSTVTLQQAAVYRRGTHRWLWAPPTEDYWGEWRTTSGDILTLSYPDRDAEWGRRLAKDLDALLVRTCRTLAELDCQMDQRLRVQLETELAVMDALIEPTFAWQAPDFRLELPTVTLIGTPVDEASYQAILRVYGIQVATAFITAMVEYECCEHAIFHQVILDYELHLLGLKPWPVTTNEQWRVFTTQPVMGSLVSFWHNSDLSGLDSAYGWLVPNAIDFLLRSFAEPPEGTEAIALTPVGLQRAMQPRQNFLAWLLRVFAGWPGLGHSSNLLNTLEQRWWQEALIVTLSHEEPPPISYPAQELWTTCEQAETAVDAAEYSSINSYDFSTKAWTEIDRLNGFGFISMLPDDVTVVRNVVDFTSERWVLEVELDGELMPINQDSDLEFSFGQTDPAGQRLLVLTGNLDGSGLVYGQADFSSCTSDGCALVPLPGLPHWSPDGSQVLLEEYPEERSEFFLGITEIDGRFVMINQPRRNGFRGITNLYHTDLPTQSVSDMALLGTGIAPFWINNEDYGYIRIDQGVEEVVLANIRSRESQRLLTLEELMSAAPESANIDRLQLGYIVPFPHDRNRLAVIAFDVLARKALVFAVDRRTGNAQFLLEAGYQQNHVFNFSPDGRWLLLSGTIDQGFSERPVSTIYLMDTIDGDVVKLHQGDTFSFIGSAGFDWSADGEWLAFLLGNNAIGVAAPAHDYQGAISFGSGRCVSTVWVEGRE